MKIKTFWLTAFMLALFMLAGKSSLMAQDEIFNAFTENMSADENTKLNQAREMVKKGDDYTNKANSDDKKTDKFFKKSNKKRAEKKSVNGKKLRLQAVVQYQKGYESVQQIFSKKLEGASFTYEEDKQLAENLRTQCENNFKAADAKQKPYTSVKDNDLKKSEYSKIKSDLTAATNLRIAGLKNLAEALTLGMAQTDKKKASEAKEIQTWQEAIQQNTVEGFQNYLSQFPDGKYASEAQEKMDKLRTDARLNDLKNKESSNKNKGTKGLWYRVQIAAAKEDLSSEKLMKIYPQTVDINVRQVGGYFKYSLGLFSNYDEAKAYKKQLHIRGAFVVALLDGEQINIRQAKKQEKKK